MNTLSGSQNIPGRIIFVDPPNDEPDFSDDWKRLLQVAFENAAEIYVVNRLSGYSGAQTWSILTQTGPTQQLFVVKFDEPKFLEREYRRATNDVTGGALFGNPVTPEGAIVQIPGNRWALMKSTLKGMTTSDTLFTHLQSEGATYIEKILRSVFTRDQRLHTNIQELSVSYGTYYDRLLPEHFRFDGLKGVDENAQKIEAAKVQPRLLAEVERQIFNKGHNIELCGFYLEKMKSNVWTLRPDRPTENKPPRIRIKYRPAEGQVLAVEEDSAIASLFGQNPQSRLDLLRSYVTAALRGPKVDKKTFAYRNMKLLNPLYFLSDLLSRPNRLKLTLIHGDLNLRNILVAVYRDKQGNVTDIKDWLIDFADTGMGPILLDFQWLEVQVILWLLAPTIRKAQLPVTILTDFFLALHECEADHAHHLHPQLRTSYTILRHIRLLAEEYLVGDWSEYYHGLVLALLGALRFSESVADFDEYAPRVAFLSAAIVLSWTAVVPADDLKLITPKLQPPPRFTEPPPPLAPSIDQTHLPATIWVNQPIQLRGTAAPKTTILVTANRVEVATTLADKTGNWEASFSVPQIGSYQIMVKDKTTNAESEPLVLLVKTPPQLDQTSVPKEISVRKKFLLTGTAHPRATVQIIANEQILATPTVDPTGHWQAEVQLSKPGTYSCFLNDESNHAQSAPVSIIVLNSVPVPKSVRISALIAILLLSIGFVWRLGLVDPIKQTVTELLYPVDWNSTAARACTTIKYYGLTVALSNNSAPYTYKYTYENGSAEWRGFEVDLIKDIVRNCLGLAPDVDPETEGILTIKDVPVRERKEILRNDKTVLIAIGSVAFHDTRCSNGLICTNHYVMDEQALAVHPNGPIKGYCDPALKITYLITETTGALTFDNYLTDCQKVQADFNPKPDAETVANREDALRIVMESASNAYAYKTNYDLLASLKKNNAEFADIKIIRGGADEKIVMWLREDSRGLRELINDTLVKLKSNGRLKHFCEQALIDYGKDCNTFPITRSAQVLPLGLALADRGDNSPLARDQWIGFDLALDEENAKLKEISIQLTGKLVGAGGQEQTVIEKFHELIADTVISIIGPTYSFQLFAIMEDEAIRNAQISIVTPSSTADGAAKLSDNNWRTSFGVKGYAGYAVDAALQENLEIKTVVLATLVGDEFTQSETKAFTTALSGWYSRGIVSTTITYTNSSAEFTRVVSDVVTTKPDLFILSGLFGDGSAILGQLVESGYTGKIIIGNALNTTEIFKHCKLKCNGIYIAQAYNPAWENEGNVVFVRKYKEYHEQPDSDPLLPKEPSQIMAQMYTAVQVITEALLAIDKDREAARQTRLRDIDLTDEEELTALRNALTEKILTSESEQAAGTGMTFDTPLGATTWFDQDGDIQQDRFCVAEIQMQSETEGSFVIMDNYGLGCQ